MGILTWLFKSKNSDEMDSDPSSTCSAEDYELFIDYLRGKDRAFSQPGRSIKEEFKFWLADHTKKQAHAANYHASRHFASAIQK
jgi:hypothetical protein